MNGSALFSAILVLQQFYTFEVKGRESKHTAVGSSD
jgi:hypothetical protein